MIEKLYRKLRALYRGLVALVQRGPHELPPVPIIPVPPPLEEVEFFVDGEAGVHHKHMVVDFGTTATVVAAVDPFVDFRGRQTIEPELLVGRTEQSSDMAVDEENQQVLAIGDDAPTYNENSQRGSTHATVKYFSSLKRYVELLSRTDKNKDFSGVVSGFLELAMKRGQGDELEKTLQCFGSNSSIVVSVPNSFNPKAVACISNGVVGAIRSLQEGQKFKVEERNVRIVRESEAVAHLYLETRTANAVSRLSAAPTGKGEEQKTFEWDVLAEERNRTSAGEEVIAVLDVGGGTTDLSVVDIAGNTPAVIMNAGIPLGGSDVDKLILHALFIGENERRQAVSKWSTLKKCVLLRTIRTAKDQNCGPFFGIGEDWKKTLGPALQEILHAFGSDEAVARPFTGEDELNAFTTLTKNKVRLLTALSVDGLFELIPERHRSRINTVILTGRGSLLPQIREAVRHCANGARVVALAEPYQLKLAVAYGCALLVEQFSVRTAVPGVSLGRQISVQDGNQLFPDYPVAGDAPTVWAIRSPNTKSEPVPLSIWEYRTAPPPELMTKLNDFISLGCGRKVGYWKPSRDAQRYLLWDPETDSYLPSARLQGGRPVWGERQRAALDMGSKNVVTGFSIGFPHED